MKRYRLVLPSHGTNATEPNVLEPPSLLLALVAADINLDDGCAELWEGERLLARLSRQPGMAAPLWQVCPASMPIHPRPQRQPVQVAA